MYCGVYVLFLVFDYFYRLVIFGEFFFLGGSVGIFKLCFFVFVRFYYVIVCCYFGFWLSNKFFYVIV